MSKFYLGLWSLSTQFKKDTENNDRSIRTKQVEMINPTSLLAAKDGFLLSFG